MESAGASSRADYRYCDLVMKGGITSGVIYPMTAVELAKEYRFKNIGGTSAGAIAAAVTAAAELGRRRNHETAFSTLAALPDLFTRFRITICAIQDYLEALRQSSTGRFDQNAGGWAYIDSKQQPPHYRWEPQKVGEQATHALQSLNELLASWQSSMHEKDGFCTRVPRPKTSLQARPDF